MKKKFICTVCGYVHEGEEAPEFCPQCKQPRSKFKEVVEGEAMTWAGEHVMGEIVWDTKTNVKARMEAECGACEDKKRIATLAKKLNLDAIHDTVHEMCKDEARHGKGFEGLYNRYFKK